MSAGRPVDQAFTFTLIDIHTDPDETTQELDALADVYRVVRDDGRHEDDIILLGDLNVDDAHLGRMGKMPGILPAISGLPTNTRGTKQYDNLLFSKTATNEYTGRSGVFDLIRQYNLTTDEALAGFGPHARLGRVQHLRRWPRRPDRHAAGGSGEVNAALIWRRTRQPSRGNRLPTGTQP